MKKNVGEKIFAEQSNWKFSGHVADGFDEHILKSVPLYKEGHNLICSISDFFIKPDSYCYEIGCSTGTLTLKLAEYNKAKPSAHFIGIDIEKDMIKKAREKAKECKELNVTFLEEDSLFAEMEPADLIVSYYTVQFIRPSVRQDLINKLFNILNWGGALLLFEKVRGADARFQDILTTLYNDYKLNQGYTPDEIISKTQSLKGVLEPFSTQANVDLLKRAGFKDIMTIQKYLCFEGFLAIK